MSGGADGCRAYYCGWAITGGTTVAHLVSSARFPLAGYRYRAWCGQMVTVVALTLNVRFLPDACPECNRYLRALSTPPRLASH